LVSAADTKRKGSIMTFEHALGYARKLATQTNEQHLVVHEIQSSAPFEVVSKTEYNRIYGGRIMDYFRVDAIID